MPMIPTQSFSPNAVDVGQGPSIARAGSEAEAWAQAGGKLANFGNNLLQLRRKAETSSYVNTANNDLERFVADKETELQAQFPKDPTGYSSAMLEAVNTWGRERLDQAPSDHAKEIFNQGFDNFSNSLGMKANAWENKKRAEYQVGLIDDSAYKDRQLLATKPNPSTAMNLLNGTLNSIHDGIGIWFDEAEAKTRAKQYGAQYASSLMEGMEANKQYAAGINLLDGKDPASKAFLQHMEPNQIANYKDRFQKLMASENEFSKRMFNSNVGDITEGYLRGMTVPQETFNQLMEQSNGLPPEERSVVQDNLKVAQNYGEVLKSMKTMSVPELQKAAGFQLNFGETTFNLKSRQEMTSKFQEAAKNILTQKTTQGAKFITDNDYHVRLLAGQAADVSNPQGISTYMKTVVEKQKLAGVTDFKVLTPELSKTYATMLNSPNPKAANEVYNGLRAGAGDYFNNAVTEMVKNQDIKDEALAMAMFIPDDSARESAFNNVSKRAQIEDAFSRNPDKSDSELTDLYSNQQVVGLKQAIIANDPTNSRLWINNAMDSLLGLEYKAARTKMSPRDARDYAVKKVITGNFSVASSRGSSVILTKDNIERKSEIEDYMDESLSMSHLGGMDISVPQIYVDQLKKVGKEGEAKDRYLQDLVSNGQWISNPSQTGVLLAKKTVLGGLAEVKDSKGNHVQVLFKDMKPALRQPFKQNDVVGGF